VAEAPAPPDSQSRAGAVRTGQLEGVLVVAKEPGPSSHDIVGLVRRLTGVRRVGHGGTLDPFAAGVLPVLVGHATRLAEYHLADEKEYRALVCFGATSTTDDLDGELTPVDAVPPTRDDVSAALAGFRGQIEQVPPDYSAVHVAGRRAYELARHGRKPELRPRTVTIHRLDLVEWDDQDPARPIATLELRCTAGTYVRALARDLGQRLGTGAYLGALTRTASGPFRLEQAHTVDAVRAALSEDCGADLLLPMDYGLDRLPQVTVDADELHALTRGQVIRRAAGRDHADDAGAAGDAGDVAAAGYLTRVVDEGGRLVAIARSHGGRLAPEKVFVSTPSGH